MNDSRRSALNRRTSRLVAGLIGKVVAIGSILFAFVIIAPYAARVDA